MEPVRKPGEGNLTYTHKMHTHHQFTDENAERYQQNLKIDDEPSFIKWVPMVRHAFIENNFDIICMKNMKAIKNIKLSEVKRYMYSRLLHSFIFCTAGNTPLQHKTKKS